MFKRVNRWINRSRVIRVNELFRYAAADCKQWSNWPCVIQNGTSSVQKPRKTPRETSPGAATNIDRYQAIDLPVLPISPDVRRRMDSRDQ